MKRQIQPLRDATEFKVQMHGVHLVLPSVKFSHHALVVGIFGIRERYRLSIPYVRVPI